jgi:hypothetical protein
VTIKHWQLTSAQEIVQKVGGGWVWGWRGKWDFFIINGVKLIPETLNTKIVFPFGFCEVSFPGSLVLRPSLEISYKKPRVYKPYIFDCKPCTPKIFYFKSIFSSIFGLRTELKIKISYFQTKLKIIYFIGVQHSPWKYTPCTPLTLSIKTKKFENWKLENAFSECFAKFFVFVLVRIFFFRKYLHRFSQYSLLYIYLQNWSLS